LGQASTVLDIAQQRIVAMGLSEYLERLPAAKRRVIDDVLAISQKTLAIIGVGSHCLTNQDRSTLLKPSLLSSLPRSSLD
jgi:hypothetical protein